MRVDGYRGRLTTEHFLLMRMPRRFWEVTFDQIESGLQEIVRSYCKNVGKMLDDGEGFLLYGNNGCGKTSAACFVAKEVRRTGASVLVITSASLIESILEKVEVDDGLLIDRARNVDFLLLDDLGKEHASNSGFSARVLENLLRERGAAKNTTFITSNMGPKGLGERYKHSMLEVLKEMVVPLRVDGVNHRDEAQERLRQAVGV